MLPLPKNYAVYPSVVLADTPTEMTVVATEKAFFFVEGATFQINIISYESDELTYQPQRHKTFSAVAHDGILRFSFTFEGEQEHLIQIRREADVLLCELHVFSAEQDLYELTPLKADFHSHSFRSDGRRDPSAEAGHYREQGYDCFALTDHNRFYPGFEIDETYAGVDGEFFRIRGEELHAPGTISHIVHIGGTNGVAQLYANDPDGYTRETKEYLSRVPKEVPADFADRYAKIMWIIDKIHADGGLAILPHPYWKPKALLSQNLCTAHAKLLLKSGMFDAYEVIGAMEADGNNRSVALWNDLRAEGVRIPAVGSSDVHGMEKSPEFPHQYTVCFATERTQDAVLNAVKAGLVVAVEDRGSDYDRQYYATGSLRLVTYTRFLLQNYFLPMQRIAQGEGVAMRAYAMGETTREAIEVFAKTAREFRLRFFGKLPPKLPSVEALEWEERWRDRQRQGPKTKGSLLNSTPNMQI